MGARALIRRGAGAGHITQPSGCHFVSHCQQIGRNEAGAYVGDIDASIGRDFDPDSGSAGASAVGPFSRSGHCRARDHLDSRRTRGHARRFSRAGIEGKPGASFLGFRGWAGRQRLSSRRGRRRPVFRLAHRSAWAKKTVLHHHRRLPHRDGADRARLERPLVPPVSLLHGMRHRRRVLRHQFDNSGAGPRALPRPTRSHDQRQLLGWRRARRRGRSRAPQSRAHPFRVGMAPCVPDRRYSRSGRLFHAHVGARESALARDPRTRKRRRGRRQGYRKAV